MKTIYTFVCLLFALVSGICLGCEAREASSVPPRPFIGAEISDVTPELASSLGLSSTRGAVIVKVIAGSPAEGAGLKENDVLLRWGKDEIPDAAALQWIVLASQAGKQVDVNFIRQGKEQTAKITLRERTGGEGAARTQADIEQDFAQTSARVKRGEVKQADAFGDADRWTLQIGPHRIFLDPFSRKWLYYDALHGTWESTGFGVGEANFAPFRGKLAAKRVAVRRP